MVGSSRTLLFQERELIDPAVWLHSLLRFLNWKAEQDRMAKTNVWAGISPSIFLSIAVSLYVEPLWLDSVIARYGLDGEPMFEMDNIQFRLLIGELRVANPLRALRWMEDFIRAQAWAVVPFRFLPLFGDVIE
jgi:hypothetical protein